MSKKRSTDDEEQTEWTWEDFAPCDVLEVLRTARAWFERPSDQHLRNNLHEAVQAHNRAEKKRGVEHRPNQAGRPRGNTTQNRSAIVGDEDVIATRYGKVIEPEIDPIIYDAIADAPAGSALRCDLVEAAWAEEREAARGLPPGFRIHPSMDIYADDADGICEEPPYRAGNPRTKDCYASARCRTEEAWRFAQVWGRARSGITKR